MARVFRTLLSRHPEKTEEALDQFSCLSAIDYTEDLPALGSAPSAFLNTKTFVINGQKISIGTSYGFRQKQAYIKRLFLLCQEDFGQFRILTGNASDAGAEVMVTADSAEKKEKTEKIRYTLFGREYRSTQAEMMYRVFEEILSHRPDLIDWTIEKLGCASRTDAADAENGGESLPSYFDSSRTLHIAGKDICIGSRYNLKAKLRLIDRLRQQAEMPENIFGVHPRFHTVYWENDAALAVIEALDRRDSYKGHLGIVAMPAGCGKIRMLASLCSRLLQTEKTADSILLLVSRAELVSQYVKRLSELVGDLYSVEAAASRKVLKNKAGIPGMLLISTAQKLLLEKPSAAEEAEASVSYSASSNLLVIVEEISYQYFSRTYRDMHLRFPNALFLGMTDYWKPSVRLHEEFGPLLYEYSFQEAYRDHQLRMVEYCGMAPGSSGEELSRDRKCALMAEWIKTAEEESFALLLCQNYEEVYQYYRTLHMYLAHTGRELLFELKVQNLSGTGRMLPEEARWNGRPLHGIVIGCNFELGSVPADVIFLDRQIKSEVPFLKVLAPLLRRRWTSDEAKGVLVDFLNDPHRMRDLLPLDFPIRFGFEPMVLPEAWQRSREELDAGLKRLSRELREERFASARETLWKLHESFPSEAGQLEEELAFVMDLSVSLEKQKQIWKQHETEIKWKTRLWCLLSKNSKAALQLGSRECGEEEEQGAAEENGREETLVPESSGESPQERGQQLEEAVLELIRRLFELDEAESGEILEKLRRQRAGTQFGFDLTFTYRDRFGTKTACMIECKNYRNTPIRLQDVAPKLASVQHMGREIDHWILISPDSQVSNELSELSETWKETFRWEPVRDIQFWTQDENVRELFGLFPDLYTEIYGPWKDSPYNEWGTEKREQILKYWKAKLAPVPRLPKHWREYLRVPAKLLTQCEGDRATSRRYEELYGNYVPMHLLDEEGVSIGGTGEAYIHQWLDCPERPCILLLGDFGDGKTYFTYTLARKLAEEFRASPKTGWIPLRLSLSDLRDSIMDCREFLHRRLREFGGTIAEWRDIQEEYHCLIILDGLDEMSLGMHDTAVLKNLERLEELIGQFQGHKLMVTSRKMAIYADQVRERILDCLDHPEVLHLSPVSPKERLAFLERAADTPQRKARLWKMQNTHDLLGLAAKPLFLEMMQVLLDEGEIEETDAAGIYLQYTDRVLERKFNMQLQLEGRYIRPAVVRSNVVRLLEELALCLQRKGTDSIGLLEFKEYLGYPNLAELLWNTITDPDSEEDANSRIVNRSLLKYDHKDSQKACFCHRSMKEYFVACGLVRRLCEDPEKGKMLLRQVRFGYEILEFAGKAILKLHKEQRKKLLQCLHAFVHETKGKKNDPKAGEFRRLGSNSINLLHYAGAKLQGNDWSGLLLEDAVLSGMDLSGRDFSFSSMRYAHMENADLTGCDLRGCDFTGVQFEKSGQLAAFGIDTSNGALLAQYKDGKLRRWGITDGSFRLLGTLEQGYPARMLLLEDGCEGLFRTGSLKFWHRTESKLSIAGYVSLEEDTRILDAEGSAVLLWKKGCLCLADLKTGALLQQQEAPEEVKACLFTERSFFVYKKTQGLLFFDLSQDMDRIPCLSEEEGITAMYACRLTETEGCLTLGYKNGRVKSCVIEQREGSWKFADAEVVLEEGGPVLEINRDPLGGLYVSTGNGRIARYRKNSFGELSMERTYQLEIRCAGAQIEGAYPEEQYEILLRAKNEEK